jgi:hypothetical protein
MQIAPENPPHPENRPQSGMLAPNKQDTFLR